MNSDEKILTVNIFGTDYPLKSTANAQYIRRVAEYVDTKMKEVHKARPNRPLHQIAILAAMNITDELLQHREVEKKKIRVWEENIEQLSNNLERQIDELMEEDEL
jgi:cell division protein ZapA